MQRVCLQIVLTVLSWFLNVTRVELIDNEGRQYVQYGVQQVKFQLQDDGRTLKVFLDSEH